MERPLAKREFVPALVLVALAVICYSTSFRGEFVFDDNQVVLQNSELPNVRTLRDVAFSGTGWRQLLFFTYRLNYYWGGLDPFGYHVLNVALHALNVLLVYWIILTAVNVKETNEGRFAALAGAAVFAVHTLFTSAVSYIAGRSSVLCATFYFLAILLFLKALTAAQRRTTFIYLFLAG